MCLQDLYYSIVENFSPQRGVLSINRFRDLFIEVIGDNESVTSLSKYIEKEIALNLLLDFIGAFEINGQIHRHDAHFFFDQCRQFVNNLASYVVKNKKNKSTTQFFLEKTPHNLLQLKFLCSLYPNADFFHVMRDPRSICLSLLDMSWGPNSIEDCASWLVSYFEAWIQIENWAQIKNVYINKVYLEDIVVAPLQSSRQISDRLGLIGSKNLFSRNEVNMTYLNRRVNEMNKTDRLVLDHLLQDWIQYFGYKKNSVGVRI
jgi:hypothetical protein